MLRTIDRFLAPVTWVAAYSTREPDPPHQLWQFTDAFYVPGVGTCDCSVFHGSIDELAALAYQGGKPAAHPHGFDGHGEYVTAGQCLRPPFPGRSFSVIRPVNRFSFAARCRHANQSCGHA